MADTKRKKPEDETEVLPLCMTFPHTLVLATSFTCLTPKKRLL